jgi:hypothetical protein
MDRATEAGGNFMKRRGWRPWSALRPSAMQKDKAADRSSAALSNTRGLGGGALKRIRVTATVPE